MKHANSFLAALNDLAVIDISGEDAAAFLNSQLTQDIASLGPGSGRLAGYCTAKGRLLASMIVWPDAGSEVPRLRALVKADVAPSLVKRLSMFVLRAKAKLSIEAVPVIGVTVDGAADSLGGSGDGNALDRLLHVAANLGSEARPYATVMSDSGTWIAAPCATAGLKRWWFVPKSSSPSYGASADRQANWQAADIEAGLPWIEAATQDLFIPQTLNLDLIDGVSFTKGCYPGQEVVARSHYRGIVKRRMARGAIAILPQGPASESNTSARDVHATGVHTSGVATADAATPGIDIFDASKPEAPCGRVINAAQPTDGTAMQLLMEVQLADLASADFRLAGPDGAAIELEPLPYDIKTAS
jgi:folate-binding protein YgfZ